MGVALIVLGHSEPEGYGLSRSCLARLHKAEKIARQTHPDIVILSGWGREGAPVTEARLMSQAWSVKESLIIEDPFAQTTVENALFARQILDGYGEGVSKLIVVTSAWHAMRARLSFKIAFKGSSVKVKLIKTLEDGIPLTVTMREPLRLPHVRQDLLLAHEHLATGNYQWELAHPGG
jgi:uncharacterized SAM-binding protein YcdF (DUF218 family)